MSELLYIKLITIIIIGLSVTINIKNLYCPKINFRILYLFISLFCLVGVSSIFINEVLILPINIFICLLFTFILDKNRKQYNLLIILFSYGIFFISDCIVSGIFGFFVKKDINYINPMIAIMINLTFFISSYLISKLMNNMINKLSLRNITKDRKSRSALIALINIFMAFVVIYTNREINRIFNSHISIKVYIINIVLFVGYIVSSIITAYFYNVYFNNELELEQNKKESEQVREYASVIEEMYDSIRKFKHDYINVLLSLNSYIEENNMDGLKEYYNSTILDTKSLLANKNQHLNKLKNIKDMHLKALTSSKLIKAQNQGIDIFIDILEDIYEIPMSAIDACRVFGILLDNAIDAAVESNAKKINFGAVYRGNSLVIIIENTYKNKLPPIYKMFESGFSTKGEGRGVGLSTVKEILRNKYKNITLNTEIIGELFRQEIWMRTSK